jgi:hypothetical protein
VIVVTRKRDPRPPAGVEKPGDVAAAGEFLVNWAYTVMSLFLKAMKKTIPVPVGRVCPFALCFS